MAACGGCAVRCLDDHRVLDVCLKEEITTNPIPGHSEVLFVDMRASEQDDGRVQWTITTPIWRIPNGVTRFNALVVNYTYRSNLPLPALNASEKGCAVTWTLLWEGHESVTPYIPYLEQTFHPNQVRGLRVPPHAVDGVYFEVELRGCPSSMYNQG